MFRKLTFPVQVNFARNCYWIGEDDRRVYGEAVTAFLQGRKVADYSGDRAALAKELEIYLALLGMELQPYPSLRSPGIPVDLLEHPEQGGCVPMCFAVHTEPGQLIPVERFTVDNLRDFLYLELGKSIQAGNAPRVCRRCGKWFLHRQGEKYLYCDRIAPGETTRTCRMVGATAVFEKKIRDEEAWLLYKRAYKKYYARMMKGNMSADEFAAWRTQGEQLRDKALEAWRAVSTEDVMAEALKADILAQLKKALNEK